MNRKTLVSGIASRPEGSSTTPDAHGRSRGQMLSRRAVVAGLDLPLSDGIGYERSLWALVRKSNDRAEGRAAFRDKRPADFQGN